MKISIIGGAGKMGLCISKILLKQGLEPIVWDKDRQKLLRTREQGVKIAESCEDAVRKSDVILVSVPVRSLDEAVKEISQYLRKDQLLIDISSVKQRTVKAMHKHIHTATKIGAHPMFGPSTESLDGQNIVLTPTTDEETKVAEDIKRRLDTMGAKTTIMTPIEHDELMAATLALPHLIALATAETLLQTDRKRLRQAAGPSLKTLLMLVDNVVSEDPELYCSIQMNLPSRNIHPQFQKSIEEWIQIVESKDTGRFVERMKLLKKELEQEAREKPTN